MRNTTRATQEAQVVVTKEYQAKVELLMMIGTDELTAKAQAMDFMLPRSVVRSDNRKRVNQYAHSLPNVDIAKRKGCKNFSVNQYAA